jgi:hypothetical protein
MAQFIASICEEEMNKLPLHAGYAKIVIDKHIFGSNMMISIVSHP